MLCHFQAVSHWASRCKDGIKNHLKKTNFSTSLDAVWSGKTVHHLLVGQTSRYKLL
jgi:hypothetical protein